MSLYDLYSFDFISFCSKCYDYVQQGMLGGSHFTTSVLPRLEKSQETFKKGLRINTFTFRLVLFHLQKQT